jgi:hypothetical protein
MLYVILGFAVAALATIQYKAIEAVRILKEIRDKR